MLNSPVRYSDPSGHMVWEGGSGSTMGDDWWKDRAPRLRKSINGGRPGLHPGERTGGTSLSNCSTISCKAFKGDFNAIVDILFPTHFGWRTQFEVSPSLVPFLPVSPGPSGTIGLNFVINRKSEEIAGFIDFSGEGGLGASVIPLPASLTGGPIVGWGSSTVSDVANGASGIISATASPDLAVSVAATVPIDGYDISTPLNTRDVSLHLDPVYGVVPFTLYLGIGGGLPYAGGGGGLSYSAFSATADFSPLLPWNRK